MKETLSYAGFDWALEEITLDGFKPPKWYLYLKVNGKPEGIGIFEGQEEAKASLRTDAYAHWSWSPPPPEVQLLWLLEGQERNGAKS